MPVAQVGDNDTIQSWFNDIPVVTKLLFVTTLISGAGTSFGWISAESQVLLWDRIFQKFQIWRLFTACIFSGGFSFPFAMHTYILYLNSRNYEANPYNTGAGGTSADYLWMLLFSVTVLLGISYLFEMYVVSEALLFVIIYVWSRKEPNAQLSMFGVKFKSVYLPWVYVAIRVIMGQSITQPILGIVVGHLYYFLVDVLPVSHNTRLITTPRFCASAVSRLTGFTTPIINARPAPNDTASRNVPARGRQPPTYNWGQGRSLGSN
jgi:hypothetical protein